MDRLVPLVYAELRRIAGSLMRRQPAGHTLQPTALVNEALVKLFGGAQLHINDRAHFLAVTARVMRQVLVDHARRAGAVKRGGRDGQVQWDTKIEVGSDAGARQVELLDLHSALKALERESPPLATLVEMFYFGGMTAEEMALALDRSAHAVRYDLRLARAWLRRELARKPRKQSAEPRAQRRSVM
jgi:RNA polymerase sigma factor (TIGR02999 family)